MDFKGFYGIQGILMDFEGFKDIQRDVKGFYWN